MGSEIGELFAGNSIEGLNKKLKNMSYSCERTSLGGVSSKQEVYMLILCISLTYVWGAFHSETVSYKNL